MAKKFHIKVKRELWIFSFTFNFCVFQLLISNNHYTATFDTLCILNAIVVIIIIIITIILQSPY